MRFIRTDEGYVNLDHVIGIREGGDGEWLITTTARDAVWSHTCSRQELEDQLRITSKPVTPAGPRGSKKKALDLLADALAQYGETPPRSEV